MVQLKFLHFFIFIPFVAFSVNEMSFQFSEQRIPEALFYFIFHLLSFLFLESLFCICADELKNNKRRPKFFVLGNQERTRKSLLAFMFCSERKLCIIVTLVSDWLVGTRR